MGDFLEENERHGIKITSSNGNSSSPPKGKNCLKMSCDSGFAEDICVEETSNVEVKNIEPRVGAMKQRGESHPGAGGDKPYRCDSCEYRTNRRDSLKLHKVKKHAPWELPYPCPHCSFRTDRPSYLDQHLRKHSEVSPFDCEVCGKGFRLVDALQNHLKQTHRNNNTVAKLFSCEDCNKKYVSAQELLNHVSRSHRSRSQTTRDPNLLEALACQLCDQTFEHEEEFQNHRAGHENIEVKLEFEKSLKARARPNTLKKKTHGRDEKCEKKKKRLTNQRAPKVDILAKALILADVQPDPRVKGISYWLNCQLCRMKFKSRADISAHMKTHPVSEAHKAGRKLRPIGQKDRCSTWDDATQTCLCGVSSQEPLSNNRPSKTDAAEKILPIEFLEDKTVSQKVPFPNESPAVLEVPEISSNETPKQSISKCPLDVMAGNSAVVDPKTPTQHEPTPIFETASNGDLEDPNNLSQPVSASGVEVPEDTDSSSKSLSEEILPPKESILTAEGGSEERSSDPQKQITRECSLVLHRLVLFPNERRRDK